MRTGEMGIVDVSATARFVGRIETEEHLNRLTPAGAISLGIE